MYRLLLHELGSMIDGKFRSQKIMTLYSDTLRSHSYRFKRLMLTYTDTEIEPLLRNARLLFEKLDKVLDAPTEATENYRLNIEELTKSYCNNEDISLLKVEIEQQYFELNKLCYDCKQSTS